MSEGLLLVCLKAAPKGLAVVCLKAAGSYATAIFVVIKKNKMHIYPDKRISYCDTPPQV
jgi:hypothetical protein